MRTSDDGAVNRPDSEADRGDLYYGIGRAFVSVGDAVAGGYEQEQLEIGNETAPAKRANAAPISSEKLMGSAESVRVTGVVLSAWLPAGCAGYGASPPRRILETHPSA